MTLPVLQLAVDVDLPLRDVPREIGDGMRDVVVRHGEDGELSDGALAALDAPRALVDCGQVSVHVTGVAAATGHLLARRRHLRGWVYRESGSQGRCYAQNFDTL